MLCNPTSCLSILKNKIVSDVINQDVMKKMEVKTSQKNPVLLSTQKINVPDPPSKKEDLSILKTNITPTIIKPKVMLKIDVSDIEKHVNEIRSPVTKKIALMQKKMI
jgi:hypothetical protein